MMSSTSTSPSRSTTDVTDDGSEPLISGLHHVNLLVPPHTLHLAEAFYAGTLGLTQVVVPNSSKAHLAWFAIASSGQQLHITSEHYLNHVQMQAQAESPRHLCLRISTESRLDKVHRMIWQQYEGGEEGAPVYCDEPGNDNGGRGTSGDFPKRFFARDYAGNRLEFSL